MFSVVASVEAFEFMKQQHDLSAKNPNNKTEIDYLSPKQILSNIRSNDKEINELMNNVEKIIEDGHSQFKEKI